MKNNWTCAYDGTKKKLKDGRCAACGRSSAEEAKRDAITWDSEPYDDAKPQHTPIPWTVGQSKPWEGKKAVLKIGIGPNGAYGLVAATENDADAAFIVRAVNCHEEWRHAMFQAIAAIRNPVDWQSCDTGQTGVKCPGIKCFMGEHRAACILEQAIAKAEEK